MSNPTVKNYKHNGFIGYKAFKRDIKGIYTDGHGNSDKMYWKKGNIKQYNGNIELCKSGYHCFRHLCFALNYFHTNNVIYKVKISGNIQEDTEKIVCDHIEILEPVTEKEINKCIDSLSNSGDYNSGRHNSGDYNSGDYNSGNWNACNNESGMLNTVQSKYIRMFNKPCLLSKWQTAIIPKFFNFQLIDNDYQKSWKHSWNNTSLDDKQLVLKLPNFDNQVFFELTGINVDEELNQCQ
jgi:hypothetical protein